VFYLLFAVTITASVQLIGVFLAFASLILPALSASASSPRWHLSFGYGVGLAGYTAGLVISGLWDVPTGAAIVCTLAFVAAVAAMLSPFSESEVTS
jgi:zinc/manganese transport system permease protein